MKKKILNIIVAILIIIIVSLFWNIPRIKYDNNYDGKITLIDAVKVVNYYTKNK